MEGDLRGRRGEDQPAVAGINRGKADHVPEKCAVCLWLAAINDGVHSNDHGLFLYSVGLVRAITY
jgi:hypothetical protein